MDNSDLLTNACATLEWAREQEREQELVVNIEQAKLEVMREVVAKLSGKPKLRRARTLKAIENLPELPTRIAGGTAETETESAA